MIWEVSFGLKSKLYTVKGSIEEEVTPLANSNGKNYP